MGKRFSLLAFLIGIVSLAAVACGGETRGPEPTPQPPSPPPPPPAVTPTVGVTATATPTPPNGPDGPVTELTVELTDAGGRGPFAFGPADFNFSVGETIAFTFNSEGVFHTFTVDGLDIDVSVGGGETEQFTFTFDKAGTFSLICIPHESLGMIGTITVSEGPSSSAPAPAPAAPSQPAASDVEVGLLDAGGRGPFEFDTTEFNFAVGETVNFTFNSESAFHTFTVDDLDIDVSVGGGETVQFAFTFDQPGTYKLICIPHESLGMVGTITVQ